MKKSKFYSIMMLVCSFLSWIFSMICLGAGFDSIVIAAEILICFSFVFLLVALILFAIGLNTLLEKPINQSAVSFQEKKKPEPIVPKAYECPNCKHTITHGTKFCPECGLKFNWNK